MTNWTKIGGAQNDGLFRHSVTGKIKFRKYREGKGEIDRSCRTTVLELARKRRDEMMAELWGEKPIKKVVRQSAGELWQAWYLGIEQTKSPKTAESVRTAWVNFKSRLDFMFVEDITAEWWTNVYIPEKRAEENPRKGIDNSKRKFFNERKWLSSFLIWCEENRKVSRDWVRPKLADPDPEIEEGLVYTDDQLQALFKNSTLRMAALLVMGEEHFMRRSEAILLTWDRVDMSRRVIILRAKDTKIRKARRFPFNQKLHDLFVELKAEADALGKKSKFVFPSLVDSESDQPISFGEFRTMWETACSRAQMPPGSRFHWLRHTGLTKAFKRARMDAGRICHFAGLSLEEADRTYLHFNDDDLRGVETLVGGT